MKSHHYLSLIGQSSNHRTVLQWEMGDKAFHGHRACYILAFDKVDAVSGFSDVCNLEEWGTRVNHQHKGEKW